jgi:hypothetical protein
MRAEVDLRNVREELGEEAAQLTQARLGGV